MRASPTAIWQDLLAAVYGGLTEELLMRLGLFTFLVWLVVKIGRRPFWSAKRQGIVGRKSYSCYFVRSWAPARNRVCFSSYVPRCY